MTERVHKLYILMRNDMNSMTPGKGMAQAAHAANAFILEATENDVDIDLGVMVGEWAEDTDQGFGTTIVLETNEEKMRDAIDHINEYHTTHAGVVHDPSYPLRDGDTLHLLPLNTCAYVFCSKDNIALEDYMKENFKLHA